MPLDPQRVQAIFLEAASHHDPADRGAILDRECNSDSELRLRIEALLRAHDRLNNFVNQPSEDPDDRATQWRY
jgi:eukaryotic-like serine/threonine-protein kinase